MQSLPLNSKRTNNEKPIAPAYTDGADQCL
jgi:hypothetical protein